MSNGLGAAGQAAGLLGGTAAPVLSVLTPAFNEAANLPLFHDRLTAALRPLAEAWEWIVVDDGSTDGTGGAVARLAARDGRVRGLRLPRNAGSHAAILHGLAAARGVAILVLAADLQDPPEMCPRMIEAWRRGAPVVWAVRRHAGRTWLAAAPSRLYHGLLRGLRGAHGLPSEGAGFFLLDRTVAAAMLARVPPPVDVFATVGRLDLDPCATVLYDRAPRRHGRSGWSFGKKLRFALRSLTAPE